MTTEQSIVAAMLSVFLGIVLVSARSLRGGGLRRVQRCRFECPLLGRVVACRIEQDIRVGRWLNVERCSAFEYPEQVACDQACRRLMNLGTLVPSQRPD